VTLLRFVSPASFWSPDYICQSAWIEHAPFAFWICDVLRPRCFVELGTHYGYSYFAFCQAIDRLALSTAAYAVDTWQGDEHAGFYDGNVFQTIEEENTEKYAAFSRLIRSTFDEALQNFEDRSVDLLHIDGRHFYGDVKHDFESWRPKLSDNAIVLLHDTSVRERGFGVWQFFEELSATHPAFQFFHCHGLGVLANGEAPAGLAPLFESSDEDADQIRAVYAGLGGAVTARVLQERLAKQNTQLIEKDARLAEQNAQLIEKDARLASQSAHLMERDARIVAITAQLTERSARLDECVYHLDRINAWGWFRLGIFLDELIHNPLRLVAKQRSDVVADKGSDSVVNKRPDVIASAEKTSYCPKVSVIIPNFNHVAFLKERIESVLTQSYHNIEIIILDDYSNDGSQDLIKFYCDKYNFKIKAILNGINSGNVFLQWKKGIDDSDGELIWICESDDFCENDFLEIMVRNLEDRSVNIAFGRIQFSDSKGNPQYGLDDYREGAEPGIWHERVCRPAHKWFTSGFGVNNVIANVGGCVWRRQALPEMVWREAQTYTVLGDWFLFCHLAGGGQIAYDPNAVSYFRQHGRNTSVSAFTTPPYYAEHERLMTLLRKQWGVPDHTIEKFYGKVSEQYRHFNMMSEFGPLNKFVSKHKLLKIEREKLHILMAFLGFRVGGGEVFPINLANALHDRGHTVSMMALDMTEINAGMLAYLNPGIAIYDSRYVEEMGVDEFLVDAGVSIIHSHMLSVDMFFFNKMRMCRKIPYLVTLHGSYEAIPIDDGSLLRIIKGVSHWVYTAEKNLETFKSIQLKSETFSKLGNAMPLDPRPFAQTRDELGIAQDAVVFTLVARGVKQKGWQESILAFIHLRDKNPGRKMHLLLCGEGEEASRLARSHAKDPNISFLGYQFRISGLYRISDCAIVPTRFTGESFPLCVIQAMQVGTPIIATKIGEIEAMVARPGHVAGILIENESNDDVFVNRLQATMQIMLEESRRTDFAMASKLNGREYNIDIIADEYYSIYKQIILNDKSRI
jgi:glycosyltransferase involved in cell wall biosynthesis